MKSIENQDTQKNSNKLFYEATHFITEQHELICLIFSEKNLKINSKIFTKMFRRFFPILI